MKYLIKFFCFAVSLFLTSSIFGQNNWKLSKDENGIKIYQSDIANSSLKRVKVECTLEGDYTKLIDILNDVSHHPDWVYNNKTSYIIKSIGPYNYYYYAETTMPWPFANRDAVVHMEINKDSLGRFLIIKGTSEPNYIPAKNGIVRVPNSSVSWYVTMPSNNAINIVYIFETDPGGSIPTWLINLFLDKAPYESFIKLAEILKQ